MCQDKNCMILFCRRISDLEEREDKLLKQVNNPCEKVVFNYFIVEIISLLQHC